MKRIIVRLRNHRIINWLPLFAAISLIFLCIYVVAQQSLRLGANDIVQQMAEDTADDLSSGLTPNAALPDTKPVNIATSLKPYVMVYNDTGDYIGGNAQLEAATPEVPSGVFEYARIHGEDKVTWQPQDGVRQAIVVAHYAGNGGGFVLSGRNLRVIESRESLIFDFVAIFWVLTIMISLALTLLYTESLKVSEIKAKQ